MMSEQFDRSIGEARGPYAGPVQQQIDATNRRTSHIADLLTTGVLSISKFEICVDDAEIACH